jgi:tRNA dimethylallyltransferase
MPSPDIHSEPEETVSAPDLRPRLVVILGPTAVGKTEISLRLAERFEGEIISADSRLFYRGMDIGTAKPTSDELARVPHHLIDVADPDETWSLAMFQQAARSAAAGCHARGRLPFLVGGTGQYVRAVIAGWQPPPVKPDPGLRQALEAWSRQVGSEGLHARLAQLDPQAAAGIDYRNLRRTIRALEVIFTTGQRFSEQRGTAPSPYRVLQIGLMRPRLELYARVDARIEAMFAAGFVEEVQRLLAAGCGPELPTMSAIGYREVAAYLQGEISLEQAVEQMKRSTRMFVRRQANWFKPDDPEIRWFPAGETAVEELEAVIRAWLSGAE